MTIIRGYFDDLHFPECKIQSFEFHGRDLIVNIKSGLEIYPPHPLSVSQSFEEPCKLVIKGVKFSRQSFNEYDEHLKHYEPAKEFTNKHELNSTAKPDSCEEYLIEGFLLNPKGWLTWDIFAEDFYLDDLKD